MLRIVLTLSLMWCQTSASGSYWYKSWYKKTEWCVMGIKNGHCGDPRWDPGKNLQESLKHIMCMYPEEGTNSNAYQCKNASKITYNSFRNDILLLHNYFRNKWANNDWIGQEQAAFQKVANMRHLTYDTILEELAHHHAINCIAVKEVCRSIDEYMYDQNIHETCFSDNFPEEEDIRVRYQFFGWAYQYQYLINSIIKDFLIKESTKNLEVFTTLINPNLQYLGCASTLYANRNISSDSANRTWCRMLVCNYGPAYNSWNKPENLFITGEPGSACPVGTKSKVIPGLDYLCVKTENKTTDKHGTKSKIDQDEVLDGTLGEDYIDVAGILIPEVYTCGFLLISQFIMKWR